jgi:allantoinase
MQSNASSEMSFESRLANVTRWMAMEPARLAGLTGKKGALAVGYDADISVFEPETEWTVTQSDLFFRHKISPYLGTKLLGRVIETYLRGERVFRRPCATNPGDRCEFSAQPEGREVRRSL